MKKGIFIISIDYEFGWGKTETPFSFKDKENIKKEVQITRKLLELFEEFDIPATWAIVGHLLEKNCLFKESLPHPEFPRPILTGEKNDWFFQHPAKEDIKDSVWFDSDNLIRKIVNSTVKHEIGSHSYSHIDYGDPNINPEAVKVDIEKAKSMHTIFGLSFNTFIFPRNDEGFYESLKEKGVKYYRGTTNRWYEIFPGILKRAARLLNYFLPFAPPVVLPSLHSSGLINIPDSMLLLGREGIRKSLSTNTLTHKAKRGLDRAVRERKIFHLWFHPSNLSFETEKQLNVLREILKEAKQLREQGKLDILTMQQVGESWMHG